MGAPISSSPLVSDQNTVNMPSEITDIKQFLEIARRKDAKGVRPSEEIFQEQGHQDGGTLGRKHAEKVWNRHERMTVGHLPAKGPGTNMFYVDKVEMLLSTSTKAQSV